MSTYFENLPNPIKFDVHLQLDLYPSILLTVSNSNRKSTSPKVIHSARKSIGHTASHSNRKSTNHTVIHLARQLNSPKVIHSASQSTRPHSQSFSQAVN
ncbi:hypothetical protein Bpfe_018932 [Biomphalaria pfeifferi]|uniref:Uncharacterized protein n=1 Tax=Biomphalaria pfeifferi TaxID=112525 RepID=A0AAD8BBP1_BIOPF|nr:hypothetical protein Bpfe_018932 [Biomphalaria pfeifferi]